MEGIKAWALELKDGWAEEEEGLGWKRGFLSPYKGGECKAPPTSLKTRLFPRGGVDGTVGLPKPVLMKIPRLEDTISVLTRRVTGGCVSKRKMGD